MPNLVSISGFKDLSEAMKDVAEMVEEQLVELLPSTDAPEQRLMDAINHGTLDGGKRLRPFLVMSGADLFKVDRLCSIRVACAVEMVHCYSLIHDDLPAMDDAETRRGKPSVHKEFDEATAILAGDALLTYAFEILAHPSTHADPNVRCSLVAELAKASGAQGMVAGQMLDLIAETEKFDLGQITRLQRMKTGDLIAFACQAGAILGRASSQDRYALHAYAHDLGLAFQIADDLLDIEGDADLVGKPTGRDEDAGKATFVTILGPERARAQAGLLSQQAIQHLARFEERADLLREIARFVVERRN
ncbi:MAG TPA: farnesyl-diphosphate synthase [Rhodospirillaceae bacterium]|nr:farnesyl-diphosphate synthase [Alphaproteobacteria bacterium]OUT42454.1 MAG: farnesyl-diphosphate synthase [Micavibrio sp. TMED2]HCI46824.1 farnesyl-diphosphate synthase [Rhodospirillaceae bacterium]MAS45898.1 farnesyl-diphosphate synthase [Alphaproteobacteria bacterium]MAX95920.1 farnesyl-diphosphate synthase [Alphaproteobacteria bacterium]